MTATDSTTPGSESLGGSGQIDGDVVEALLAGTALPQQEQDFARPSDPARSRRSRCRHLLPRSLEPRQGRAINSRRQLHRIVFWKVYVKDGIITWESQETDYPSVGANSPEYEPRGCPRGAAFSWYTYSPRESASYVRGVLLEMYREARARLGDPVDAFGEISTDPEKRKRYQSAVARAGSCEQRGGSPRDRCRRPGSRDQGSMGLTVLRVLPIPAMSMASHAAGARYTSLLGGTMISFYDWYADLPIASPQIWGDQTDVPESADWWNASYLIMWGSNLPTTRTPDAHFMTEARYKGRRSWSSVRTMPTTRSLRTPGCRPTRAPTARSQWRWDT